MINKPFIGPQGGQMQWDQIVVTEGAGFFVSVADGY